MKIFEFRLKFHRMNFVTVGPINNIPALVQIMAWRRPGDKPFAEPMMVSLVTHICVTRLNEFYTVLDVTNILWLLYHTLYMNLSPLY